MLHRTTILFFLACLLGAYPAYQSRVRQQDCIAANGFPKDQSSLFLGPSPADSNPCGNEASAPVGWVRGLGILSVICFAGFVLSFGKNILDRQRERRFLRAAGVDVAESDLPLED